MTRVERAIKNSIVCVDLCSSELAWLLIISTGLSIGEYTNMYIMSDLVSKGYAKLVSVDDPDCYTGARSYRITDKGKAMISRVKEKLKEVEAPEPTWK